MSEKRGSRTSALQAEVRQIEDSRGRPTVRVVLTLGDVSGAGDVPAGASTGEDEAATVPVSDAIGHLRTTIVPMIRKMDADLRRHASLLEIETAVIEAAGPNFADFGANAVVPISRALWQLAARLRGKDLCAYVREFEPSIASAGRVCFYMNIFNGGLHALREGEELGKDRIDIQEVMVVPVAAANYREALAIGERIDATLQEMLVERYGAGAVTRADEAGFSVRGLGDSDQAIAHVFEAIERSGLSPGSEVKLALDVASSSFYDASANVYRFRGRALSSEEMTAYLVELADRYAGKIISIEDGLGENDWDAWTGLTKAMRERGVLTIGDDLFVTQMRRLRRGVNNGSADAILIKVNQNGSMSGTVEVMKYARENGMRCVISHRSGETLDDSIADLAVATGALGLKSGDPQPVRDFPDPATWVRRRKYLRMIELEESR